jgi:2-iminobutanoate/2-iminopropanoate deaminase
MKSIINTAGAPAPIGPYSQAVKAGNLLFVSGQIALHPESGQLVSSSIEEETRQVLANISAILKEAGADWKHIVKTTIFLKDMNNFPVVNQIYGEVFSGDFPARETVEVSRLPKDVNVEISVIASL